MGSFAWHSRAALSTKVLRPDLRRLGDRREVHLLIGLRQRFQVRLKLAVLLFVQGHACRRKQRLSALIFHYACSFPLLFSQTMRTDTSAGDTPEIRLACPRFWGRWAFSFSAASSRSPRMAV